ncbi:HxlR family transcriptional regulator [Planomonospora parontospora subsp. parontospora]|uniref:HxlR family transcriptional regulator n=2 Tax=Planomonospora parontospora TaxID=58119 RepID=A0AA37BHI6_9ACTN|nr:helix-turn-helix domain-containing protein [Planomonospora parontospora]GGK73268.1 HxlR family transcriptional regulator [Planomonospora parontospora]GII09380.1 HxlR family transcriptional regulator [Planomonospora parontospora subsp. parontospora]
MHAERAAWTPPASADPEQACPVAPVVDIVFSRWTTPILWTLNYQGRQRFVELQRRITTITPKVLTQRLRQLERDGLVVRTYHPEVPPRVEYEISDLGRSLAPLFAHLAEWATAHLGDVERARHAYDDTGTAAAPQHTPRR